MTSSGRNENGPYLWMLSFHEWFPSEACDVLRAEFMDIMTRLGPRAWYPVRQCCEARRVYDEKTPSLFKTEWDGYSMVALSSKTYYCRDSQGQDKLSSKGLQKKANDYTLTYETYRHVLFTGLSGGGVNQGIRVGPGGQVYTHWQERTGLSYVYLKRRVVDDGIHTEPLHLWTAHGLPACPPSYLPSIWPPPAPPMLANMKCTTCDCSGPFACSSPAVPGVASSRWPLD